MNKKKTLKLIGMLGKNVRLGSLRRLVDGDLSDIGDALLQGKEVVTLTGGDSVTFGLHRDYYKIIEPRITIGDVSFPKPITEAPEIGTEYWVVNLKLNAYAIMFTWRDNDADFEWLSRGLCHLTEEAAKEHSKALIKLSGGNLEG